VDLRRVANAEEAQDGQTKPDFVAKMAISRKESRESRYWLRVAVKLGKVKAEEIEWELKEAKPSALLSPLLQSRP